MLLEQKQCKDVSTTDATAIKPPLSSPSILGLVVVVLTPWTWYPGGDAAFAFWRAELWQVERVLQIQLPFSLERKELMFISHESIKAFTSWSA